MQLEKVCICKRAFVRYGLEMGVNGCTSCSFLFSSQAMENTCHGAGIGCCCWEYELLNSISHIAQNSLKTHVLLLVSEHGCTHTTPILLNYLERKQEEFPNFGNQASEQGCYSHLTKDLHHVKAHIHTNKTAHNTCAMLFIQAGV